MRSESKLRATVFILALVGVALFYHAVDIIELNYGRAVVNMLYACALLLSVCTFFLLTLKDRLKRQPEDDYETERR